MRRTRRSGSPLVAVTALLITAAAATPSDASSKPETTPLTRHCVAPQSPRTWFKKCGGVRDAASLDALDALLAQHHVFDLHRLRHARQRLPFSGVLGRAAARRVLLALRRVHDFFVARRAEGGPPELRTGSNFTSADYAHLAVQYPSDVCAPVSAETLESWRRPFAEAPARFRRGDSTVCPAKEACWLLTTHVTTALLARATDEGGQDAHRSTKPYEATNGQDVTIFLSSGARPQDAISGENGAAHTIVHVLSQTRAVLGLGESPGLTQCRASRCHSLLACFSLCGTVGSRTVCGAGESHAVVVFDGVTCKPQASRAMAEQYAAKIDAVSQRLHGTRTTLVVHDLWLHKVESLRRAFRLVRQTPLVYVAEVADLDESNPAPVPVPFISRPHPVHGFAVASLRLGCTALMISLLP